MCGICGFVSREPLEAALLRVRLNLMNDALAHRGPDDEGYFVDRHAGLAMRRLSIIDLDRGHQPIANEDGTLRIVFNGEIYNYRELRTILVASGHQFRTNSDTETILHGFEEWGHDVVQHLEGMFAFAIWNSPRRELFLARDRFGQKPLYTARLAGGLAFASEPKAFYSLPGFEPQLDLVGISHYLSLRSIPGDRSLLEGVTKLPAGTRATWQDQRWTQERWWRLRYSPKHRTSPEAMVEELDALLARAVSSHMVADVPVGAFLSGGIDSSTVVALMAGSSSRPIHTFSIGVREQGFDERPYAAMVAEKYGTSHHAEEVNADLVDLLPRMIRFMDEPVDPFAAGVYLVSQVAAKFTKVALGGDGGDELFGGYDRYVGQRLVDVYAALPSLIRTGIVAPLIRRLPDTFAYKSLAQKLRWMDEVSRIEDPAERYAHSIGYLRFPFDRKRELFEEGLWLSIAEESSADIVAELYRELDEAPTDRILHSDVETRLAEHMLPLVDRMSMAHSLEVRSPFLDRELAEFAARIPAWLKLRRLRLKYMLRRVASRYLPAELVRRRKQGFGFPLAHWFRGPLYPMLHRVFSQSSLVEDGVLRQDTMANLLEEHRRMEVDHNYRLWLLLALELWYRMTIRREAESEVREHLRAAVPSTGHQVRLESQAFSSRPIGTPVT
jgi:asparagine synthase (glutamine-hydrolysing)